MTQLSLFADEATTAVETVSLPEVSGTAADAAQRLATDPQASVWVGASAGTGKTKVLTDRALRLMLAGTAPEKILCLTFTKAAAAEMASRINMELGLWAKAPGAELNARLARLLGRGAGERERRRARSLFPAVLDAPGGLKVLTLHAFCQSLLARFPLEAGIAPHFSVMDERDADEALAAVCTAMLTQVRSDAGPLAAAFATVTAHLQENAFRALMVTLAGARDPLSRCLQHYGSAAAAAAALHRHLGVEVGDTEARVIAEACAESAFDGRGLRATAEALLGGSKTDRGRGAAMAAWLAAEGTARAGLFADYCRVFLTKGEPPTVLRRLITKACAQRACAANEALCAEGRRLMATLMRLRAVRCAESSAAVLTLAEALLAGYQRHKSARALLDYDDLIARAADLLETDGGAAWVLYKLDGGIDHVLIDEAQDTSAEQWRIVRALTAEFFSGSGRSEARRSVFAVGDVKQSIFSFQGADPALFLDNGRHFAAAAAAAGQRWREVHLAVSFRSTRAVLAAVDAVFALEETRGGVALDGAAIVHEVSPTRAGDGGLVEIWPPIQAQADDEPEPWRPPVERVRSDSPQRRLARVIARRIEDLLGGETLLEAKGRPVRAEDILVLVRRRTSFVEELVRALKGRGIPVAGVDRMVLNEQIAVMDLIALGRFVLLPEDDLTLACVLKGPLVGFDDDDLFDLAHERAGSLWSALRRRQSERARFGDAVRLLVELLNAADSMPPFEFYAHVLGPRGGRRALLSRLGQDADDPIAEFLDLALGYERRHAPSLEGFLHWLTTGDVVVKRDLEQAPAAVRIMTVHGAKGLQAPIVFLPDTMQVPGGGATSNSGLLWPVLGDGIAVPLWPPHKDACEEVVQHTRALAADEQMREYRRLLYVAMTRAEDRLIVCGWRGKTNEPDGCWYHAIRRGLEAAADDIGVEAVRDPGLATDPDFDTEPRVLRLRSPQERPLAAVTAERGETIGSLPEWATSPAAADAPWEPPLVPSLQQGVAASACSPVAGESAGVKRGRLIHGLLQRLPDVAPAQRRARAAAWLARTAPELAPGAHAALIDEVLAVLDHAEAAALFAPGSLAEVPISGMIGPRLMSAQVDRLAVMDDAVMIVDYKTDRPAPTRAEQVAARYLAQMAAYRAAIRLIYPRRTVRCALLWTAGPSLMVLPDATLDRHAP